MTYILDKIKIASTKLDSLAYLIPCSSKYYPPQTKDLCLFSVAA